MNSVKVNYALLICSIIILLFAVTGCDSKSEYINNVSYSDIKTMVENKDDFILYVANKSCSHCKVFEPKFKEIIDKYKVKVNKLDTATLTTDEYKKFISLVGDVGTPTVLFFYKGEESGTANRINGDVNEEKIINRLKVNNYIK